MAFSVQNIYFLLYRRLIRATAPPNTVYNIFRKLLAKYNYLFSSLTLTVKFYKMFIIQKSAVSTCIITKFTLGMLKS